MKDLGAISLTSDQSSDVGRRPGVSATYDETVTPSESSSWQILHSWEGEEGHQRRRTSSAEGHFCLLFSAGRLGSHLPFCRQEAQRPLWFQWTWLQLWLLQPTLTPKKCVKTNVSSTFPCSGQFEVALSTATGVSFLLFTRSCICQNSLRKMECGRAVSNQGGQRVYEWRLPSLDVELNTGNHATHWKKMSSAPPTSLFGALGGHGRWVRGGGHRGPWSNPPTLHER